MPDATKWVSRWLQPLGERHYVPGSRPSISSKLFYLGVYSVPNYLLLKLNNLLGPTYNNFKWFDRVFFSHFHLFDNFLIQIIQIVSFLGHCSATNKF